MPLLRRPGLLAFPGRRWTSSGLGYRMRAAPGWQVRELTRSPFALGLPGMARVAPPVLLAPVSGQEADRCGRRRIAAVNLPVTGTSNQPGGFRAETFAAALDPVTAVVLGGAGSALHRGGTRRDGGGSG